MAHGSDAPAPAVRSWPRRLALGAVAAAASAATMVAVRMTLAAPTPIDMLFDLTGHVLGVPAVFNIVHALPYRLGDDAKYVLFGVMALAYTAAWASAALPLLSLRRPWRLALPVVAMPALVGAVLLPLGGLGIFGLRPTNYFYPPLASHLWAAGFGLVYGAVLLLGGRGRSLAGRYDAERREALSHGARALLVVAFGLASARLVAGALARAAAQLQGLLAQIRGLVPVITPVKDHYVVSKNFTDPRVDGERWRLKLHGQVEHALDLSLTGLKALPSVTRSTTLICISNEVGGHLVGNSLWTGVPMRDLLDMAGVRSGATHLLMRAADNYLDDIPLEVAKREGTMVAYLQDGEPLVRAHGFPARVLAPGLYGMKNVKWVVDLEVTDRPIAGYWEQRGWSRTAVVKTMSRIDTPRATKLGDRAAIGGIAFAGIRGVKRVQVSVDNGQTWQTAALRPADNDFSWTLWGFEWHAGPGEYEVLVRAVDGSGRTQTATRHQPLPDGATGYDRVRVRVD